MTGLIPDIEARDALILERIKREKEQKRIADGIGGVKVFIQTGVSGACTWEVDHVSTVAPSKAFNLLLTKYVSSSDEPKIERAAFPTIPE